jgi:hypothetical protein
MPLLSEDAIKTWTKAGHKLRQQRTKISTSSALLNGTNAKLPPLKIKVKLPTMAGSPPKSRQQRRAEARKGK